MAEMGNSGCGVREDLELVRSRSQGWVERVKNDPFPCSTLTDCSPVFMGYGPNCCLSLLILLHRPLTWKLVIISVSHRAIVVSHWLCDHLWPNYSQLLLLTGIHYIIKFAKHMQVKNRHKLSLGMILGTKASLHVHIVWVTCIYCCGHVNCCVLT